MAIGPYILKQSSNSISGYSQEMHGRDNDKEGEEERKRRERKINKKREREKERKNKEMFEMCAMNYMADGFADISGQVKESRRFVIKERK